MKFCSDCGALVSLKIPEHDDRARYVCDACGIVHYQNPRLIVGTVPCFEDKVLLCKRAIEPRYGLWTLPAGFMENDETTREGATRETTEEAGARIRLHGLYTYYSLPHINQVHMFYRADLTDLDFAPGVESLEVELFTRKQVPWDEIAFPAVGDTLEHYFNDLPAGHFPVRAADVVLTNDNRRFIRPHD